MCGSDLGTLPGYTSMPSLKTSCYIDEQLLYKLWTKGGVSSWLSIIWAKQNCQDTVVTDKYYTKGCKGFAGNFNRYGTIYFIFKLCRLVTKFPLVILDNLEVI